MTRGHLELRVSCPDGFSPGARLVKLAAEGGPAHAAALRGALEELLKDLRRDRPQWVVFDLRGVADDEPIRGLIRHFVPTAGSGRLVLLAGASAAFAREMRTRRSGQAPVQVFDTVADALAWLRRTHPESCGGEAVVPVTAAMVGNLRRRTGAAIMTCRDALELFNANEDVAAGWLETHGMTGAATKRSGGYGHAIPVPVMPDSTTATVPAPDAPAAPAAVIVRRPATRATGLAADERERGITIASPANEAVESKLAEYDEARRSLDVSPAPKPMAMPARAQAQTILAEPSPEPSPEPESVPVSVSTIEPMAPMKPVPPVEAPMPPMEAPMDAPMVQAAPAKSRSRGLSLSLPSIPLPSFGIGKKKKSKATAGSAAEAQSESLPGPTPPARLREKDMAPPQPQPAVAAGRAARGRRELLRTEAEAAPLADLSGDIDDDGQAFFKALAQPADGVQPDAPDMELVEVIKRMATVRYFSQMNPGRVFPLSVRFTKEKLQEWHTKAVSQVSGDTAIEVRADDPFLTVRPNIPGCHVTPAEQVVDLSAEETAATFTVSPYAAGHMTDAAVEMVYHDEIVQTIRTPLRITTQRLSRAAAALSFLSPAYMMGLQAAGLDPTSQAKQGFPLLATIANPVGGLTNLGLLAGVALLAAAGVFYWLKKPKKSDPIYIFYNGPGG